MNSQFYVIKWTAYLSKGLQDVLTNKQHMENKNMNTLQENINNLQKQLLEKDEIIRSLIET